MQRNSKNMLLPHGEMRGEKDHFIEYHLDIHLAANCVFPNEIELSLILLWRVSSRNKTGLRGFVGLGVG
jgi:hypothetical protein